MIVKILKEAGHEEAVLGLSLSRNKPIEDMPAVAQRLAHLNGGHNKFLESIAVWLDITAPRYWWQQFDTIRIGMTKQSGSTMYTIMKQPLTRTDFARPIPVQTLARLNSLIADGCFDQLKVELPEGFLQRRIVCTNYQTIRRIVQQRYGHRLTQWGQFCRSMMGLEHFHLIEIATP